MSNKKTSEKLSEFLNQFENELPDLMYKWDPRHDSADYVCSFCGRRPATNDGGIVHRSDCLGKKFLTLTDG